MCKPKCISSHCDNHVVASTDEAETGGGGHNSEMSIPIQVKLEAMNPPQLLTPVKT